MKQTFGNGICVVLTLYVLQFVYNRISWLSLVSIHLVSNQASNYLVNCLRPRFNFTIAYACRNAPTKETVFSVLQPANSIR